MLDEDDPIIQILMGEKIDIDYFTDDENKVIEPTKINIDSSMDIKESSNTDMLKNKDKNKKEIKKQEQKMKYPQLKNPLDFVNYIEMVMPKLQSQKFILDNYRENHEKYQVIEMSSLNLNQHISNINLSVMCCKQEKIILGTKDGLLLILSLKEQNFIKKIIPKNIKNPIINCLDITNDFQEILCGYQDGSIALINAQNGETKFVNNKVHKDTSCIELKILKKEKQGIFFISSGGNGQVFYNIINIGLPKLLTKINSNLIMNNGQDITIMIKFYSNPQLSQKYAILGSSEAINIFNVEPKMDKVFEILKPSYIKKTVVPDAQIGIGGLPGKMTYGQNDEKNNLLLIISWENVIILYQLQQKDKDIIKYNEVGYFFIKHNIIKIGFLSNSIIYCINEKFDTLKLNSSSFNIDKLNEDKFKELNLGKIDKLNNDIIKYNHYILPSILYHEIIKNQKDRIKSYFYSIIDNNFSVYVLGVNLIYQINLIDWQNFLDTLKTQGKYVDLFSIGIDLYNNKYFGLSNISNDESFKKELVEYLRQTISFYMATNKFKDFDRISNCISLSIEVCIEINAVQFLLEEIQPLFEERECQIFLDKFTPFVLSDRISHINLPTELILRLLELYCDYHKKDTLSQILLHLNIKSIDKPEIRSVIEKENLILPLIYISINGEKPDYFAPIYKMFDIFQNYSSSCQLLLINEENNAINYGKALNDEKIIITLKEILNSKEYIGHKILWYIKWILTGKNFPNEEQPIETKTFENLVPKLTYWLLGEKVIKQFLQFDPKDYFMIQKNNFIIKRNYELLVKSANDPNTKITTLASLLTSVIMINDIEPSSLIELLGAWSKKLKDNKILFFYYDFIIAISNVINIKKELKIESSSFILKHYVNINKPINKLEAEMLNINIINYLKNKEIFTDKDYQTILKSINHHIFDEIKLFLYNNLNSYKECLDLYLSENSIIRDKINRLYKWIQDKLDEGKKTKNYPKFLEAIKENVLNLAKISIEKFYRLAKQLFWDDKKAIVNMLAKDKNVQLNFIELYIEPLLREPEENEMNKQDSNQKDDLELTKYFLGLHIKLLCDLKKFNKIVPSLQACTLYPFEKCLEYCEKANAYEGRIFLLVKGGDFEKALNLSKTNLYLIFTKIENNIRNNKDDENEQKLLYKDFDKYINDGKKIGEISQSENIWFNLLTELYRYEGQINNNKKKYEKDIKIKNKYEIFHENISQCIKELIEKMCSFVSIKSILNFISDKKKDAGFKEFRDVLIKILENYDNLSNILISAKSLLTNLILENEIFFQILNLKGELLKFDKCDKCHKIFNKNSNNNESVLIFLCDHIFHKTCVKIEKGKDPECPLCNYDDIGFNTNKDKSLIKRNTTVIEKDKPSNNNNQIQVKISVTSKKMIQKLQKFDNNFFNKRKILTDLITE